MTATTNTKPLSPDMVRAAKLEAIPKEIIESVNELLIKHFNGVKAIIPQDEVIAVTQTKVDIPRPDFFDRHLLDFEDLYREQGWKVEYDKLAYNDTYGTRRYVFTT